MHRLKSPANLPFSSETAVYMYRAVYRRIFPKGATLFIACMPKSGSTYLSAALCNVTGFRRANLTYAWERGEQDLYLPRLVDDLRHNSVVQQHVRVTAPNRELFKAFDIRPIVLTRNLFDVVVSIRDYLVREGIHNFPWLYATERFYRLSESEQLDFLIEYALPWYVQFYVGWYETWRRRELDLCWMSYESLVQDWTAGVEQILEYYGIGRSPQQIQHALRGAYGDEKVALRLNRGVSGLGRQQLSERQCERIRSLVSLFPEVDFSPVGISAPPESGTAHQPEMPDDRRRPEVRGWRYVRAQ